MSAKAYLTKYPNGKVPQNSRDHGKIFICRRGCDTRSTTYTTEFVWEEVFHGSEEDINSLITRVKSETKLTRKRRLERSEEDQADGEDWLTMKDDHNFTPRTPRKKQKVSAPTTPARLRVPSNLVTPNKR
jgi:origin recognition complex subunit 1